MAPCVLKMTPLTDREKGLAVMLEECQLWFLAQAYLPSKEGEGAEDAKSPLSVTRCASGGVQ
jgi:hypothetical protein